MEELNRTFAGIRIPPEVQQRIAETQLAIRQKSGSDVARFSPPDAIEIVILPLGELQLATFDLVRRKIPEIAAQTSPFSLVLEGLGGTPNAIQPRFVWLGMGEDTSALRDLHDRLEYALRPLLPNYLAKPFAPHVDLGRIKIESEQNRMALGRAIRFLKIGCIAEIAVSEIELFRGTATTMGPRLTSEATYPLRA